MLIGTRFIFLPLFVLELIRCSFFFFYRRHMKNSNNGRRRYQITKQGIVRIFQLYSITWYCTQFSLMHTFSNIFFKSVSYNPCSRAKSFYGFTFYGKCVFEVRQIKFLRWIFSYFFMFGVCQS